MKRIYNFARQNSARNYTVSDLQELKVSGKKLTMANPANAEEILAKRLALIYLRSGWINLIMCVQ
jgi:3-methyl-2-oxobutanoate hydroxymethyltransferase